MSLKVLVIPEDPRWDEYILQPLISKMMEEVGKARADVLILRDPCPRGFPHIKRILTSGDLNRRYGHYDLWIFMADGDVGLGVESLEAIVTTQKAKFFACAVMPELEIVLVAGHPAADRKNWSRLRTHETFKESIFEPFRLLNGNISTASGGRRELMQIAIQNYQGIKKLIPELASLEKRIKASFIHRD